MFGRMREGFNAWRRGEKRVAPYGSRGRVWVKKDDLLPATSAAGEKKVKAGPTAVLEMKVTRADGTVETIRVPATAEQIN